LADQEWLALRHCHHVVADRAQSFERHVAALELPLVVLFEQQC
jgi:hypothetical protein